MFSLSIDIPLDYAIEILKQIQGCVEVANIKIAKFDKQTCDFFDKAKEYNINNKIYVIPCVADKLRKDNIDE